MKTLEKKIVDRLRQLADDFDGCNLNYVLGELEHIEDMIYELSQEEETDENAG